MHAHEFVEALTELLRQTGGEWTELEIRRDTKVCRDEIYSDTVAHGGTIDEPFFNLTIRNGWAVFTFFEADFSVYVLRCEEYRLIGETEALAMDETVACKQLLSETYGKLQPDLVVPRAIAEQWMEFP